ncbi:MAG: helix-turn-helix domain-containing protein [Pseudoflavonifractor sp.]|nr:helix-turn-helix domain-containing protein [Pseudoflavonifractor sp.]
MDYQERRRRQAEDTRRAILDSAARLTRKEGFDKVTIRDICRAAGVTTGAFYHHFSSKEDLLNQGFVSLDVYMEQALAPYAGQPPIRRLEVLLECYAGFMEDQGWETVSRYYGRRLADPAAASMSPNRFTLRAMLDCLRDLADSGELSAAQSPEWAAEFFFRHFRGIVVDWVLHRGSYELWTKLSQDYQLFERAFRS